MTTRFTVRGSFSVYQPPERATAHVTLTLEGPEPKPAYDGVARALADVSASVAPLHRPQEGPVTWWSASGVRTWSERPWKNGAEQPPVVHHAAVEVKVKFSDFDALAEWLGRHVTTTTGFSLDQLQWALTDVRARELVVEARRRAVQDAVSRAQEYADALGLGAVAPVEIADAGMLPGAEIHGGSLHAASGMSFRGGGRREDGGRSALALIPEDIEIAAAVDARFEAAAS